MTSSDDENVTIDMEGCARCEGPAHTNMTFRRLLRPVVLGGGEATHWAMCPVTSEPILMAVYSEGEAKRLAEGEAVFTLTREDVRACAPKLLAELEPLDENDLRTLRDRIADGLMSGVDVVVETALMCVRENRETAR